MDVRWEDKLVVRMVEQKVARRDVMSVEKTVGDSVDSLVVPLATMLAAQTAVV